MKILQINTVCGIKSTGKIATDMHNEFLRQGHESYIAYGREEAKNCDNIIKIGNKLDNYWHVFMTRIFDKHGFGSKRVTLNFINKIKKLNPDVIYLHNIHGYYINIDILFNYLRESNKKIIWHLYDCWSFTGHCAYFDFVGCTKWQTECYDCPQLRTYPESVFSDNSQKNYLNKKKIFSGINNLELVVQCNWMKELLKKSILKEYKVSIMDTKINLDIFKKRQSNLKEKYKIQNKFIILGLALPWSKRKGLDDFIKLSPLLKEDEVIVLMGLSDEQKRNVPSNIITIEKTNNHIELAEVYSIADILFNPTYEDNYPTVNLEAIACGTYLITYNTGGSPESIKKEEQGYVVEKGDIEGALKIIREKKENKG